MFIEPDIMLSHRFEVTFMAAGLMPNPIDIRFQSVRNLASLSVEVESQGSQTRSGNPVNIPRGISKEHLILERGVAPRSPLTIQFVAEMYSLRFTPSTITVFLFDEKQTVVGAWLYIKAVPVKWTIDDLDASQPKVLIDKLEFAFERVMMMRY